MIYDEGNQTNPSSNINSKTYSSTAVDTSPNNAHIDFQCLLASINKSQSFNEKLYTVLNWSGFDPQRIAFSGTSWINDSAFYINVEQLAHIFNVKPDTINSSLRNNGFIKQLNQTGQRYFWTKRGFSMKGIQSTPNVKNSNSSKTIFPKKTGNQQFDEISSFLFIQSETPNKKDFVEMFYKRFCGSYIEFSSVESIFNDFFTKDFVDYDSFWLFYQHFGPMNSLLAKYSIWKTKEGVRIGEKNEFIINKKNIFFNNLKKNVGKLYLRDENGMCYDSWEKAIESLANKTEMKKQRFPVTEFTANNQTSLIAQKTNVDEEFILPINDEQESIQ